MLSGEEIKSALKLTREPWPHQVDEWVASQDILNRGLRWDMGTGKTVEAVGFLRLKYRKYQNVGPTLILAPLSTLAAWKAEFLRSSPEGVHSKVVVAAGMGKKKMSGKKRAALIAEDTSRIVITNHASLTMPDVVEAFKKKGFEYIVIDEIHEFKGHDSKRLKNLLSFSDRANCRLGLTGTLLLNNFFDVWGPCRILDGGARFGTNFYSHFRRKYFFDANAGAPANVYYPDWQPMEGMADLVAEKLASLFSDVQKHLCMQLPPRIIMREEVELSEEQQKLYDEMEDFLITSVERGDATASNALVKILRMRQIISGFVSVKPEDDPAQIDHVIKSNPRLDRLAELLAELTQAHKVVVWSNFRANYPRLRELAEQLGVGFAELTGDTKDRQGEIERFQKDPKCRLFFANPQAGGTGVDGLQHVASYCVYFDRSHNLAHYLQSRDRIYRGGSEVHQTITEIHLVAPDTVDEDILTALEGKENFADDVLERVRLRHAARGKRG